MNSQLQDLAITLLVLLCIGTTKIHAQSTDFFGVSSHGGNSNFGTIVMTDGNGENMRILFSFPGQNLGHPINFCEADNGKIYGIAIMGPLNQGLLFEWNPNTDLYSIKVQFNGTEKGANPLSLMKADNGKLYGVTSEGGAHDFGVFFEWDLSTETFTKNVDFNRTETGEFPTRGKLVQAHNGRIYGMTKSGGANGIGFLFEWDPLTRSYANKLDFEADVTGSYHKGILALGPEGKLYGTTSRGGADNRGVLFSWDPGDQSFIRIMDFNVDSIQPAGPMILADNGKFYGTSSSGGRHNKGMLFEYDPSNDSCSAKIEFDGGENGGDPKGVLIQSSNGTLYGMTEEGGANDFGVLFEYDILSNTYNKRIDLNEDETGRGPAALIQTNQGIIFGLTAWGGIYGHGSVFEWDPETNNLLTRFKFNSSEMGRYPKGPLLLGRNGNLYGTTTSGGIHGSGVIFEWSPDHNIFTKKYDLLGGKSGESPGSLKKATNGKLYGMTPAGGSNENGIIFEWDPVTNIFVKKFDFNLPESGAWPQGSLTLAGKDKLYGLVVGGPEEQGILFEWDPVNDTFTKKIDFNGIENGSTPLGSLAKATNGKLYGMTNTGGEHDKGVLFEWDPYSDSLVKRLDFDGLNGSRPDGNSLVQAQNGKLYGMTQFGGIGACGVLFEFDPTTNNYVKLVDFDLETSGSEPLSSPFSGKNGKIYGSTTTGGVYNYGAFYEWDPADSLFTIKYNFSNVDTRESSEKSTTKERVDYQEHIPPCSPLVELVNRSYKELTLWECDNYTAPSGKYTWSDSGIFSDTIANARGGDSIITINLTILLTDTVVFQNGQTLTASAYPASYQWIDCNNENATIKGAMDRIYIASHIGAYAVIVTENGCVDTSGCHTVSKIVGMGNPSAQKLRIFPNPNEGNFTIDLGKIHSHIEIRITATDGQIIQKVNKKNARSINMEVQLKPGIYFVAVTTNQRKIIRKIIIN